ncbi:hypothetical protein [Segniliparus rugosus]|uniref:Uncharacterized protein n=1 Tax=Segniliparus rugosus (strain ATCC BAA-974 / DSM 45345 / CCUG 50838 / CIP 108380 / JCM 13579 / CDC 945) TaxID=679197 RepID=E5XT34_SEGRC|nr:hypothetical protein [Segniliparus rugosus]EFV12491.1 hypothetical protein HMPREF9336_02656 [Segniliparus rugosus ATCC BAA-974]
MSYETSGLSTLIFTGSAPAKIKAWLVENPDEHFAPPEEGERHPVEVAVESVANASAWDGDTKEDVARALATLRVLCAEPRMRNGLVRAWSRINTGSIMLSGLEADEPRELVLGGLREARRIVHKALRHALLWRTEGLTREHQAMSARLAESAGERAGA